MISIIDQNLQSLLPGDGYEKHRSVISQYVQTHINTVSLPLTVLLKEGSSQFYGAFSKEEGNAFWWKTEGANRVCRVDLQSKEQVLVFQEESYEGQEATGKSFPQTLSDLVWYKLDALSKPFQLFYKAVLQALHQDLSVKQLWQISQNKFLAWDGAKQDVLVTGDPLKFTSNQDVMGSRKHVYKAKWLLDGEMALMTSVRYRDRRPEAIERAHVSWSQEVRMVKTISALASDYFVRSFYCSENPCVMYLEFCNFYDWYEVLELSDPALFPQYPEVLRTIVLATNILHENGIVHRDIKPENVFMHCKDGKLVAKLGDFGSACLVTDVEQLRIGTGTTRYMSSTRYDLCVNNCKSALEKLDYRYEDRFSIAKVFHVTMLAIAGVGWAQKEESPYKDQDCSCKLLDCSWELIENRMQLPALLEGWPAVANDERMTRILTGAWTGVWS